LTCRAVRCKCPIGFGSETSAHVKAMSGLMRRKTLCEESPGDEAPRGRPGCH